MTLKNNLAIITGVSTGIGFASVKALLDQHVKVAGWGRSKPAIDNNNFFFYTTDITDYDAVKSSFEAIVSDHGTNICGEGHISFDAQRIEV